MEDEDTDAPEPGREPDADTRQRIRFAYEEGRRNERELWIGLLFFVLFALVLGWCGWNPR